jgi:hypothetical protein
MGADLYIEPLFSENQSKYKKLFDEAVKARDAFKCPEIVALALRNEAMGIPLSPEMEAAKLTPEYAKPKELQNKVDEYYEKMYEVGYFRDSYNDSSLFAKLGLSWWAMAGVGGKARKVHLINGQGKITQKNAKLLLTLVKSLPIQITEADLQGWAPGTTVANLQEYFDKKKANFISFIECAIANKCSITASV